MQSKYALSCQAYKNNIFTGLASLQQDGEFVDLTLAADGHFVKVHQLLIAMASPYIKELMSGAPCPHPVIFLNNVSHQVLSLLLEYIYNGEVMIQQDYLVDFLKTAKALQITSLVDANPEELSTDSAKEDSNMSNIENNDKIEAVFQADHTTEVQKKDYSIQATKSTDMYVHSDDDDDNFGGDVSFDDDVPFDDDEGVSKPPHEKKGKKNLGSEVHFTVSNQGCLQVIMNRFLYHYCGMKNQSKWRVWRCSEYHKHRCHAKVITEGNKVVQRMNPHTHTFHDKRIMDKVKKGTIFATIESVVGVKKQHRYGRGKDLDSKTAEDDDALQIDLHRDKDD